MSKATTKTTEDEGVHRLRDIRVEEVSLVDRPANKRKFLIVKSEEKKAMPTGAEVVTGPNGTLTAAPAQTPGATPPAGGAAPEVAKAGCSLTKEMKQALSDVMTVALEGLGSAKEMVDSATEVGEVEKADVSALGQQLSDAADLLLDTLEGLEAFLAPRQADPAAQPGQAAPGAPVQQRDPNAPPAPTSLTKSLELARAQGIVKRAEEVKKYGAKMSRGRLKVFEESMKTLSTLLEELKAAPPPKPAAPGAAAPPPSGEDDEDPKKPKKKPAAPGAAPAAAPPAPPPPAAKSASDEEAKKTIAKLESELRAKTAELANIRKGAAPTSNAAQPGGAPVEGNEGEGGGTSFHWPMDMNDDIPSRGEKADWMGD